jgi:hypothetical protein
VLLGEEKEEAQVEVRGGRLAVGEGVEDVKEDGSCKLRGGAPS